MIEKEEEEEEKGDKSKPPKIDEEEWLSEKYGKTIFRFF